MYNVWGFLNNKNDIPILDEKCHKQIQIYSIIQYKLKTENVKLVFEEQIEYHINFVIIFQTSQDVIH